MVRMKTDQQHMTKTIANLKQEMIAKMKIKCGLEISLEEFEQNRSLFTKPVTLDELEEADLKKMILELRLSNENFKEFYEDELNSWNVCI